MKNLVADFPHVRLLCIGTGELQTTLETDITDLELTNNVFLVGHIHEASGLLKAADLFVLPSKSESYGYVLHEAGLARVPIIASKVGGITDIIASDLMGTLINPEKPQELEAAMRAFLTTPHQFTEKTQALEDHLRTRTVSDMTKKTVAVYQAT